MENNLYFLAGCLFTVVFVGLGVKLGFWIAEKRIDGQLNTLEKEVKEKSIPRPSSYTSGPLKPITPRKIADERNGNVEEAIKRAIL